ncbi:PilW family protein [Thiocapsa sp.]|uniref:PilW family protein n=1 Tax=Thiocapsa sp. TaxID=2024551 RepID=UPI003593BB6A
MKHQRGLTLISLMVGLTLSLLTVGAMMAMYRITVGVAADAGRTARFNGEISNALFVAKTKLQAAGFGIDDPAYQTDFFVLRDAVLASGSLSGTAVAVNTEGNAVVWAWVDDEGDRQCELLLAPGSGFDLVYVSRRACSSAANWASIAWGTTPDRLMDDFQHDNDALNLNASIHFEVVEDADERCRPFGLADLGEGSGALTVHMTITDDLNAVSQVVSVCLANFPDAPEGE